MGLNFDLLLSSTTVQVLVWTFVLLLALTLLILNGGWRWLRGETLGSALTKRKRDAVLRTDKQAAKQAATASEATRQTDNSVRGSASEPGVVEPGVVLPAPPLVTIADISPVEAYSDSEEVRGLVLEVLQKVLAEEMANSLPQINTAGVSALEVLIADVRARDLDRVKALGLDHMAKDAASGAATSTATTISTKGAMLAGYVEMLSSHVASVRLSGNKESERVLLRAQDVVKKL